MANDEPWKSDGEAVEFGLIWRFIDQTPVFVMGVEAGILSERMARKEATVTSTTHSENEEELRNLAAAYGYRAAFEALGEDEMWQVATFTRE